MDSPIANNTPGPSPWYLRLPEAPCVEGFRWEQRDGGRTLLIGPQGAVAALGFYIYVQSLDPETLLIWFQKLRQSQARTYPVELLVVRPRELRPLRGFADSVQIRGDERPIILEGEPAAQIELETTEINEDIHAEFPPPLQNLDELLVLCHSSGIDDMPGMNVDLALLVAQPPASSYRLHSQDWFNASNLDFGHQWVTRVARDPKTKAIHGDGIRIQPFVLDETMRRLAGGLRSL